MIIHHLIPATVFPDGPLTAVAIDRSIVLVDVNKITIVFDAAFSVETVELDACKLLEFGLLFDIGTSNPIVVAADKALSVEDGAVWSTFVVPTVVFETTSEQCTYWANRHRPIT